MFSNLALIQCYHLIGFGGLWTTDLVVLNKPRKVKARTEYANLTASLEKSANFELEINAKYYFNSGVFLCYAHYS